MWNSILGIIKNITDHYTPERKIQRLKNELDDLEYERANIYVFKADEKQAKRLIVIERRIDVLHRMLKNAAD